MSGLKEIKEATSFIKNKIDFKPAVGIILSTGLGALVEDIKIEYSLSYKTEFD